MNNYYKKQIALKGSASTIPVMEWIKENKCPDLDHTVFYTEGMPSYYGLIVSKEIGGLTKKQVEKMYGISENDWFEYKGMFRTKSDFIFFFYIDGVLYIATC